MNKGILFGLFLLTTALWGVQITGQDAILLPAQAGKPSELIPVSKLGGVDYLIQYDGGEMVNYLSGLLKNDTLGVFFIPPAACSLLEVYFCRYPYGAPVDKNYKGFACDVPDGVTLDSYHEYHDAASTPGSTPMGTYFAGPADMTLDSVSVWEWDTLKVASKPDIGKNAFFAGYTINEDSTHSTRIDAGSSASLPPFYAIAWKQAGTAPAANGPGWYSSWHLFWIRALVRVYENLGAEVKSYDKLPYSYVTSGRDVTANIVDVVGVPANLRGVKTATIHYKVNNGSFSTLAMARTAGDSLDGTYTATIPGAAVGDSVSYFFTAFDYQDAGDTSKTYSYKILAGTAKRSLVMVESDAQYGGDYSYDAIAKLGKFDFWDEETYGQADESVLNFYRTGEGRKRIFWIAWSGFSFAADTAFLKSFLDGGGQLFISSQDLPCGGFGLNPSYADWVAPDGHFVKEYLKAIKGYDDYNTDSVFTQFGSPGDPVTGATELSQLTVFPYLSSGNNYAGKFDSLGAGAVPIFYGGSGEIMGYRYEDVTKGYRVIFLYWPFQYILTSDLADFDTVAQDKLVSNSFDWLVAGVGEGINKPIGAARLYANAPNPVVRGTHIRYSLATAEHVVLRVYDLTGSLVRTLVDQDLFAGDYETTWNGCDEYGLRVAAGAYFYRLETRSSQATNKLILLR
jgi:hypothetical protein